MNDHDLPPGIAIRRADAAALAPALTQARHSLLRLFDAWRAALPPALTIRYAPELNPPLWELGHVAWFEEYWIARNPQRRLGKAADPDVTRAAPLLAAADRLYDSSRVAHARRWQLDLPDARHTAALLEHSRERTLALLQQADGDDASLYFFRLALLHEDMHREAWVYMSQHLALDVRAALDVDAPAALPAPQDWVTTGGRCQLGSTAQAGFAFDNELGRHELELAPYAIGRSPVRWREFLPFVDDGGYEQAALWSQEGWAWCQRQRVTRPRYLDRENGVWRQARFGRWVELELDWPAMHLTWHEAQAWCRWAGRRLPTEAEWEHAAVQAAATGEAFDWSQVWEWTASAFAPYPGFEPHPYRDYSMPWFDGRPVLRGASFATAQRMKHPRYRNYFEAGRNDLFAGFRTCAA